MRAVLLLALMLAGCDRPQHEPVFEVRVGPLAAGYAITSQLSGNEKLSDLGREGLRVAVEPFFGRYSYYVSLRRLPVNCVAKAHAQTAIICGDTSVHVRRIVRSGEGTEAISFIVPRGDSGQLFDQLDWRLTHWKGSNFPNLDGTSVSFERVSDGKVWSMWSNVEPTQEPNNPAAQLRADLLRILRIYGPNGFAPEASDWHVAPPEGQ